jgi:hypothetical protein
MGLDTNAIPVRSSYRGADVTLPEIRKTWGIRSGLLHLIGRVIHRDINKCEIIRWNKGA